MPKIRAIKDQYGKSNKDLFEMDMIGHSMGSDLIQNICEEEEQTISIRRAITVGTPYFSQEIADIPKESFDIIGTKDCLNQRKSTLQKDYKKEIETGHLGLLFHHESLNAMVEWLA